MFKISVRFGHMYELLGEASLQDRLFALVALPTSSPNIPQMLSWAIKTTKPSNSGNRENETVIANTLLSNELKQKVSIEFLSPYSPDFNLLKLMFQEIKKVHFSIELNPLKNL